MRRDFSGIPIFPYTQRGVHPPVFKIPERKRERERKSRTMSGGNSELAEVQEKLELLNAEYDKLNDEWTGRLAAQQDEFQREKYVRATKIFF